MVNILPYSNKAQTNEIYMYLLLSFIEVIVIS